MRRLDLWVRAMFVLFIITDTRKKGIKDKKDSLAEDCDDNKSRCAPQLAVLTLQVYNRVMNRRVYTKSTPPPSYIHI